MFYLLFSSPFLSFCESLSRSPGELLLLPGCKEGSCYICSHISIYPMQYSIYTGCATQPPKAPFASDRCVDAITMQGIAFKRITNVEMLLRGPAWHCILDFFVSCGCCMVDARSTVELTGVDQSGVYVLEGLVKPCECTVQFLASAYRHKPQVRTPL